MTVLNHLAASLRKAYKEGPIEPIGATITEASSGVLDAVSHAYQIQDLNSQYWEKDGRKLVGRKIGLTSAAVQTQLGVSEPDYGMLYADMEAPNHAALQTSSFLQPKIEAEIAFKAGQDISHKPACEETLASMLTCAYPALEVVDSRIKDWRISLADTIADNASSASYILGAPVVNVKSLNLVNTPMQLTENNELVSTGSGAECLGNPLNAALWLVSKMIDVGRPIKKGDIILSGALGPMVNATAGHEYQANIKTIGNVTVRFI